MAVGVETVAVVVLGRQAALQVMIVDSAALQEAGAKTVTDLHSADEAVTGVAGVRKNLETEAVRGVATGTEVPVAQPALLSASCSSTKTTTRS